MENVPQEVREFLRAAGRKGGLAKSAAKQRASRANGKLSMVAPTPEIVAPQPVIFQCHKNQAPPAVLIPTIREES